MRILLVSLGTGPSVEHGIARSIRDHRPDRVIYFVTEQSMPVKEKVDMALGEPAFESQIVKLSNGDDPNEIYRQACEILKKLQGEGVNLKEDVLVDFTSGTKAMSAGLFAAALAYELSRVIYVSGQRGSDGRVISGAEHVITFTPLEIFADRLRRQIIELFNRRLFSAALQLIESGLREIHLPQRRYELEELKKLCLAYQAWDWFDHKTAARLFAELDKKRWPREVTANKEWVDHIVKKLQPNVPAEKRYSDNLVIDLWLNAERRMEEGHWIDAVARLYRLIELIAQFRLANQHNLDTGNLEVERLPGALKAKYEALRDEKGRVQLGLRQAYELLKDLGDPLGQSYDERLQSALQARNDSIGGHGLRPVSEDDCRQLMERAGDLLNQLIPNWQERAQQGRFPLLSDFIFSASSTAPR